MADDQPTDPQPKQQKAEAKRYTHDELRADARALTGYSPHAVEGMLAAERGKTLTLDDAKAKVRRFLGRAVETDEVEA